MSAVYLPLGRAFEAWGPTHRHQQGVVDRRHTRGGQKHVEEGQAQVRNRHTCINDGLENELQQ